MIGLALIEGGEIVGKALLDMFVERLVEQVFSTAGNYATNAISNALPDFSSLGITFKDISKLVDFQNGSIEDKKNFLRNTILKQIEEMNITVISNSELKALRDVAQAANGNGDLKNALSELNNLNK